MISYEQLSVDYCRLRERNAKLAQQLNEANRQRGEAQRIIGKQRMEIETLKGPAPEKEPEPPRACINGNLEGHRRARQIYGPDVALCACPLADDLDKERVRRGQSAGEPERADEIMQAARTLSRVLGLSEPRDGGKRWEDDEDAVAVIESHMRALRGAAPSAPEGQEWQAERVLRFACEDCDLPEDVVDGRVPEWWLTVPQEGSNARRIVARTADEATAKLIAAAVNVREPSAPEGSREKALEQAIKGEIAWAQAQAERLRRAITRASDNENAQRIAAKREGRAVAYEVMADRLRAALEGR